LSGAVDVDDPSDEFMGLIIAFDHVFFIGVITNIMFGMILMSGGGGELTPMHRWVLWGINIGLVGFVVGLITLEALPKQLFTPLMGTALLVGIASHLKKLTARTG
jgi:hypothetical protein